jgi:hypothetical protein
MEEEIKIETIKDYAKEVLKKNKKHLPHFIFVKDRNCVSDCICWKDDEEKYFVVDMLRHYVHETKPDYYFTITEAFMIKRKKDEYDGKKPSLCDDKVNVVVIEKHTRNMFYSMIIVEYKIENDEVIFLDETNITERGVSLFDFYIEKEIRYQKTIENMNRMSEILRRTKKW